MGVDGSRCVFNYNLQGSRSMKCLSDENNKPLKASMNKLHEK